MEKAKFKCRICGSDNEKQFYIAKEKHFDIGHEFRYFDCRECDTLQIEEIPVNISDYYPAGYYSKFNLASNPLKAFLKKLWYKSYSHPKNPAAQIVKLIIGDLPFTEWLGRVNIDLEQPILDVGSGSGNLLYHLNQAGFKDLTGIDPFIDEDIFYNDELRVIKGSVSDLAAESKKFKLIYFSFSYEHISDPLKTLQDTRLLQNSGDDVIIRIPVHNSYSWKKYGTDWANLDAPRHFQILSEKSMAILAEKSDYTINNIVYDSGDFQFWGSELYKNNIPLTATKFGSKTPMDDFRSIYSKKLENENKKLAKLLNERKEGDQATFYLKAK